MGPGEAIATAGRQLERLHTARRAIHRIIHWPLIVIGVVNSRRPQCHLHVMRLHYRLAQIKARKISMRRMRARTSSIRHFTCRRLSINIMAIVRMERSTVPNMRKHDKSHALKCLVSLDSMERVWANKSDPHRLTRQTHVNCYAHVTPTIKTVAQTLTYQTPIFVTHVRARLTMLQ